MRKFLISSLFQQFRFRLGEHKIYVCSFWLIFCPLDPDPGTQNVANPTYPDPKQALAQIKKKVKISKFQIV